MADSSVRKEAHWSHSLIADRPSHKGGDRKKRGVGAGGGVIRCCFHSPGATSGGLEGLLAADEQVIVVVEDDGVDVTRLRRLLE